MIFIISIKIYALEYPIQVIVQGKQGGLWKKLERIINTKILVI